MLRGGAIEAFSNARGTKRDAEGTPIGTTKKIHDLGKQIKVFADNNPEEAKCAARKILWDADPWTYLLHGHTVEKNLHSLYGTYVKVPRPLSSFKAPWNEPFDFHSTQDGELSESRVSIVLAGTSNTGKTYRALAEFARPLLITNGCMETIKSVVVGGPYAHTHLVFDEFNYRKAGKSGEPMTIEDCLTLLYSDLPGTIPGRYDDIKLPMIPRIFTTNLRLRKAKEHIFPWPKHPHHVQAMARRHRVIHVMDKLW